MTEQQQLAATAAETPTTPYRTARIIREDRWSERTYTVEYTDHDGTLSAEQYRSVTTAIKGGLPSPAIPRWAARETATHAIQRISYWAEEIGLWGVDETITKLAGVPWGERQKKADIGTAVHEQIEALILGAEPPPLDDAVRAKAPLYLTQFRHFADRYQPVWLASELVVVSQRHGYAGTLDAVCRIGDRTLLADFKTTNQNRDGKPGVYLEVALQLSAYRAADWVIDRASGLIEPMPHTDGGLCVWLAEDRFAALEIESGADVFEAFCHAKAIDQLASRKPADWYIRGALEAA